ncbi:hypothetical protein RJ641_011326 [Dillenia turbinata]|uniref:Methionine aminopeptidase n=1 Tax=Dillenia turbinata TaxID=194707 RepID=A0AAN8V9D5_9MAGN
MFGPSLARFMLERVPVVSGWRPSLGRTLKEIGRNCAELMLTLGSISPIMWDDNWTVITEDGSLSAQFEHTIDSLHEMELRY